MDTETRTKRNRAEAGQQPSQENENSRVVSARLRPAEFMSLTQELDARGMKRGPLLESLIRTWLDAVTGRGYQCVCPDCPGNMTGRAKRARYRRELVEAGLS